MFYAIDTSHPAKSFDPRIRALVLHYTAADLERSLDLLTKTGVSSHYLVPETPIEGKREVFRLVEDRLRAWHAGISSWQERTNLNDTSIGIEIVNLGYQEDEESGRHWFPFPEYQVQLVADLARYYSEV